MAMALRTATWSNPGDFKLKNAVGRLAPMP
jgi:hypothetical protein